jgi:hypothetical protein
LRDGHLLGGGCGKAQALLEIVEERKSVNAKKNKRKRH